MMIAQVISKILVSSVADTSAIRIRFENLAKENTEICNFIQAKS